MKIIERLAVLAAVACCAAFAEARQMPEVQLAVGQDAKLVFQEIKGIRELGAMYPTEGNAVDVKWTKGEKAVNLVGVAAGTETLLVKGTDLEGNSDLFVYSLNVGSGAGSEEGAGLFQNAPNALGRMDFSVSSGTVAYNGDYHKLLVTKVWDAVTGSEITEYDALYSVDAKGPFVPEKEFKGIKDVEDPDFGTMVYFKITADGYNDRLGSAPLTVLPRNITVKALDGEKVFDANPGNPEEYRYELHLEGFDPGEIKEPKGVVPGEEETVSNLLCASGGKFDREAGEDVNEDPGYLISESESSPFVANNNYVVKCETARFKIHPRPIIVVPPGKDPPSPSERTNSWMQVFSVTNAYNGLGTNIVVKYGNIFKADGFPATDVDIVYSVDKSFAPQYIVLDNWRTNVTEDAEHPLRGTNVWCKVSYGDNYIGTNAFAEVVITQRVLTVEAEDASKSYGEKDPCPFAWTLPHAGDEIVAGEKEAVLASIAATWDPVRYNREGGLPPEEDVLREDGKPTAYEGVISTNNAAGAKVLAADEHGNYRIEFVPGDFTITGGHAKYDMYGEAGDWIGVYNGKGHTIDFGVDPESNRTRDGVVHQTQVRFSTDEKASWTDWIDWTNCYENANLIPRFTDVVDKATIWVQAKNEPNYPDVIETNATVTITQRVISVTAEDARKKYGEDDPKSFDFTYDLKSAEEIGEGAYVKGCLDTAKGQGLIVFKRAAGEDVLPDGKSYAITNEVAFAGPCLSNYRVVYNPGEFLIDRDDITVVPPPPEERPEGAATPYDYIDVYKGQERGYTIRFMLDPAFAAKEPHGKTQVQFSLDGSDWSEPTDYIDSLDADYGDLIPKFTNVTDGARKVWVKATNEPNYNETNFYGFVTITQRVVTVTAPSKTLEPEEPLPTDVELMQLLNDNWDTLVKGTLEGESDKIKVGLVKLRNPDEKVSQPITAEGEDDQGNYFVEYIPGFLTVKPKIALTIYLGETNVLFGAAVPDFTWDGIVDHVVCDEDVNWDLVTTNTADFVTTYKQFSPVGGDYPITVRDGTLTSERYAITVVPGKVIVGKRPIEVIPPGEEPPTVVDPEQPWAKAYSVTNGYNGLGTNIVVKYGNIFGTDPDGVQIAASLAYYTPDKIRGRSVPDNWCTNATGNAENPLLGTNVVCNVSSIDNYIDCDVFAEVVITQSVLIVKATDTSKVYGTEDPVPFGWSITNEETIAVNEVDDVYATLSNVVDLVRFNRQGGREPLEEDFGTYEGVISTNTPFGEVVIGGHENYRFEFVPGDFKITGNEITIVPKIDGGAFGCTNIYDGVRRTISFKLDPPVDEDDKKAVVRFSLDGTWPADGEGWIEWDENLDQTDNMPQFTNCCNQTVWVQAKNFPHYPKIAEISAAIVITQRVVVVTADSDSKVYDGTPLTQPNWKVSKAEGHGFVDGEGFDVIAMTGDSTITNVGVRNNVIDVKTVTYNQKTNPNNYIFDYRHGTLAITPRPIVPGEPDDPPGEDSALAYAIKGEKVYDGQPTNITVGVKGIVEGEEGLVKMVYSETAPDESTVWLEDNPKYTDVAGNEEQRWVWCKVSAGDNYTTAVVSNYVLIKKRPVTLTSPTKTVSHDKIPLTFDETEVKDSPQGQSDAGYVDGERFAYSNFATNNTPGTTIPATFDYASDTALVDNYRVTQTLGQLTVKLENPPPSPCGDVTQLVARVYQIQLNTYTTRGQAVDGGISGGGQCGEPTTNACVVMRGKDKTVIRGYVYICDDLCNLADYSSVFVDVKRNGYADTAATKLEWRFCNAIGVHSTDAEAAWTLTADFQYDDTRHQKYVLDGAGYGYAIWEASRLWIGNTLHFDDLTGYFAGLAEGSYDLKTPKSKIACACDRSQVLNCTNFGAGVDIGFVDSDTVAFGRWKMRYNDKLSVAYAEGKWNPISAIRNLIK